MCTVCEKRHFFTNDITISRSSKVIGGATNTAVHLEILEIKLDMIALLRTDPLPSSITTLSPPPKKNVICDLWHMTCDTLLLTPETWHVTCDTQRVVNTVLECQIPSSDCLLVKVLSLYCDERRDILWNIAWVRGKSRGRSPREIPRAEPKGFPKDSGYISQYIPTEVTIQTFSFS